MYLIEEIQKPHSSILYRAIVLSVQADLIGGAVIHSV